MKDIAVFGVGGFGREVLSLIQNINAFEPIYNIIGFFDDGHEKGEMINGYPVLGKTEDLNHWPTKIGIAISIGNPVVKKKLVSKIHNPNVVYPTLIHPNVVLGAPDLIKIGRGCIICAGNIITTNATIGDFVILNLDCTVGHDTVIGDYGAYMPACNISGEVLLGEGVYCGTGVKIINQTSIGEYATIGAGAVITKPIPGHCTAVGVPAKVIKQN
jgi:sugar O-acyltransferase (sialic acid O-acetyltransferase NeuD family)